MAVAIRCLNLVLLGRTGIGKSASGNTILGREAFKSKKSSTSVTRDVAVESGIVCGRLLTVYDTPGLFNTEMSDHEVQYELIRTLQRCDSGLCVFLLVIKADRFTGKERKTVEKIEELLGDERLKKTWILFTGGDELEEENTTIEEYINLSEPLKKVVQKYDQRYHVFNNKTRGPREQVRLLLEKIKDTPDERRLSRWPVLLGKSGVGKSAAGETILGQREFNSVMRMSSVTSECSEAHDTVSGRSETVERLRAARQRYEENRKRREESLFSLSFLTLSEDEAERPELERLRAERQRYEENRKRREESLFSLPFLTLSEDEAERPELERLRAARQRYEENRKRREEIQRMIEEEERLRAERRREEENRKRREEIQRMIEEEERLRAERRREEENRKQREEIQRMIEEAEERLRAARQRYEENRKRREEIQRMIEEEEERRQKWTCVCS